MAAAFALLAPLIASEALGSTGCCVRVLTGAALGGGEAAFALRVALFDFEAAPIGERGRVERSDAARRRRR